MPFRLDRFLSVMVMHPLTRLAKGSQIPRIPILMYHGIRGVMDRCNAYYQTTTSPETFYNHMRTLQALGYRGTTLEDGFREVDRREDNQKTAIITFDDGYKDFYDEALPILMEFGHTATVFVVSGFPGISSHLRRNTRFDREEFMSWSDIRDIHRIGIEIGSHTHSHPKLDRLAPQDLQHELQRSKGELEDHIQANVESFSHPFAFPQQNAQYMARLTPLLSEVGYVRSVSTNIGTAALTSDPYHLPRLPVNNYDDPSLLRAKLEGAYDWMRLPQHLYKSARRACTFSAERRDISPA